MGNEEVLTAEVLVASTAAIESGWTTGKSLAGGRAVAGAEGDAAQLVDEEVMDDGEAVEDVAEMDSTTTADNGWFAAAMPEVLEGSLCCGGSCAFLVFSSQRHLEAL